jgi:integrase
MSVRRDPRTDRWYFRARVTRPDGARVRIYGTPGVSGPFHELPNTKVGAQEAERRAIAGVMTGRDVCPEAAKEVPTVRQYSKTFLEVYAASHKPSSNRDKRQRLDAYILPAIGDLRLDEVRQEHVDELVAALLKRESTRKGVTRTSSRKGINNTLGVLSSLLRYAARNGVIGEPTLTFTIKAQGVDIDAVAPEDVTKLAAAADARYRVALLLAADAGLRIGEIRALPWLDVNEIAREVTIAWSYDRTNVLSETKGWDRRVVPISERLWEAMRALERRGPLVFARLDGKPIGYDAVRDVVHEIYVCADVAAPMKPWHSLRHTFGTELANAGASIQTIRELMGHKSIETTLRYLHTTRDQKRAAIAGLAPTGSRWAAGEKSTGK